MVNYDPDYDIFVQDWCKDHLVKPLGNDIPCIALVMVRITFPGGVSNVPQRFMQKSDSFSVVLWWFHEFFYRYRNLSMAIAYIDSCRNKDFSFKKKEFSPHCDVPVILLRFPGSGRATSVFWPLAKSVILRTLVSPHFMRRVTMFGPSKFKRRGCQTQDFMSVKSHTMTMSKRNSRCQSGSSF